MHRHTVNFITKLSAAWVSSASMVCVGLEPDLRLLPPHLRGQPDAIFRFCRAIVDATADVACAIKPQIAYFSAERAEDQLEDLCRYVRNTYPTLPIVLDAKRGDIGATANQYAREAFERYGADAVTVNPYMGFDSIAPYLEWRDRGTIVVCRSSNAGNVDLQGLKVDGIPLYQRVAQLVAERWNIYGQCALMMGACDPVTLAGLRKFVGDIPLLVTEADLQRGVLASTVAAGRIPGQYGMMIDSSRAMEQAMSNVTNGDDFVITVRGVALGLRVAINAAPQERGRASMRACWCGHTIYRTILLTRKRAVGSVSTPKSGPSTTRGTV
jgi:orotidine-5'-phosphate decarboxylase